MLLKLDLSGKYDMENGYRRLNTGRLMGDLDESEVLGLFSIFPQVYWMQQFCCRSGLTRRGSARTVVESCQ